MWVWFDTPDHRVKLEIGSTIRPDPYSKRQVKTYIQEFLETQGDTESAKRFGLHSVNINVLNIERTFIDKIMSVKRHAVCGTLNRKVRHVYDVTKLFQMSEIQTFLSNKTELKRLVHITKETDAFYIGRRNISETYNPIGAYDFTSWQNHFDSSIRSIYEKLHESLLYTDEKQDFAIVIEVFRKIDYLLQEIEE